MSQEVENPYSVRRASFPEDRSAIIRLWRESFSNPAVAEQKFAWFYESSPYGMPLVYVLEWKPGTDDERVEVVGVAAAGFRRFHFGEEKIRAAVLVDLAVAQQHRSLFPALMLQKELMKDGLSSVPFLYGFPNKKAAPVFQRVGYVKLGDATRFVRVVRPSKYLEKRLPGSLAAIVGNLADFLDRLLLRIKSVRAQRLSFHWYEITRDYSSSSSEKHQATVGLLQGERDARFLSWRFCKSEGARYFEILAQGEGMPPGRVHWVVEPVDDVLHVQDCSAELVGSASMHPYWYALFLEAGARGFKSVSFECLAPEDCIIKLLQMGMRERSKRPVFGAVSQSMKEHIQVASLFLTAADEDE